MNRDFSGSEPFPLLDKSPGVCYTEIAGIDLND